MASGNSVLPVAETAAAAGWSPTKTTAPSPTCWSTSSTAPPTSSGCRSTRTGRGGTSAGAAEGWAHDRGLQALTLTTFGEIACDAPYYARLGFHVVADDDVTLGVGRIRDEERARGLDRWRRVVMRPDLPAWAPWTPEEPMARLRDVDVPWAVAGG